MAEYDDGKKMRDGDSHLLFLFVLFFNKGQKAPFTLEIMILDMKINCQSSGDVNVNDLRHACSFHKSFS